MVFAANAYLGSMKVVLQTLILFIRAKYPVCLLYLMNTYLFPFFLSWEENLHVAMVTNASGEKRRFKVSTDVVWKGAVVTGLVFHARSDCDLVAF